MKYNTVGNKLNITIFKNKLDFFLFLANSYLSLNVTYLLFKFVWLKFLRNKNHKNSIILLKSVEASKVKEPIILNKRVI